jgi:hypothetical protein
LRRIKPPNPEIAVRYPYDDLWQLLDGLMAMLTDSSKEIRSQADAVIECFLRGLEEKDAAG